MVHLLAGKSGNESSENLLRFQSKPVKNVFCSEIAAASMLMKLDSYCRTNEHVVRSNTIAGTPSAELNLPKPFPAQN